MRHKLFQLTGPWFLWECSPLRIRRQPVILYAPGALATRKRPPTLTSDNRMTPKPNLALNAEMKAVAERLTLPAVLMHFFRFALTAIE